MKTAAKVFIIIGMVFGFYLIFPLVIGILALKKLDEAKTKDELILMGILTLILCSLLGGLFMLLVKEEDLAGNVQPAAPQSNNEQKEEPKTGSMEEELKKLSDLKDKNLITEEEYNAARKTIIDKYTK